MKTKTIKYYDCPKCNEAIAVKVIHKENRTTHEIIINKCAECGHQAGLKELFKSLKAA